MHELSLAEGVREIVDETARSNGAARVTANRIVERSGHRAGNGEEISEKR